MEKRLDIFTFLKRSSPNFILFLSRTFLLFSLFKKSVKKTDAKMKKILHKANKRGYFDFGWLKTNHTFSFGNYYNSERVNFGMLRVLNDDVVAAGQGFGIHPHKDMEIVSIPLNGALAHKDSTGTEKIIVPNEVQVMSAGTGILHSEYNHSKDEETNYWCYCADYRSVLCYNESRTNL